VVGIVASASYVFYDVSMHAEDKGADGAGDRGAARTRRISHPRGRLRGMP
jgi:hypothetical protein